MLQNTQHLSFDPKIWICEEHTISYSWSWTKQYNINYWMHARQGVNSCDFWI
jgi:hypothetical protein